MPTYIIEREINGIGNSSQDELKAVSQQSVNVLNNLGPEIKWNHSYITDNKIYCVYEAPSEDLIREHARQGGFPADSIKKVENVISPATAG
jgi:hypothetical protein